MRASMLRATRASAPLRRRMAAQSHNWHTQRRGCRARKTRLPSRKASEVVDWATDCGRLLVEVGLAERGLGGRQPGDRYAEGRARDVVQPDLVAEPHRLGVAAVLAADAHFQIGARLAPEADRHLHELADAALIDRGERVLGQNLLLQILHQEPGLGVVA